MSEQPTPTDDTTRALLILLADRINAVNPNEPMTERDRLDLCAELTDGDEPHHSTLRALSVEPYCTGTRAEYAARLRARAGAR
jgi:hypothetical protein